MESIHKQLSNASKKGNTAKFQQILDSLSPSESKKQLMRFVFLDKIKRELGSDAKSLLSKGADPNSDDDDITALIWASIRSDASVVEALLAAGADVNKPTLSNLTALMCACRDGHSEIVKMLIAAGAHVNAVNFAKWTALMKAARYGHAAIVEMLLAAGADVNAVNDVGHTALTQAALNGHVAVVELFLAHPRIYQSVSASEAAGNGHKTYNDLVRTEFLRWHMVQNLLSELQSSCIYSVLPITLQKIKQSGVTTKQLSAIRDADGFTVLGRAALAGASKKDIAVLIEAGVSVLVTADLNNTSPGDLANKAGHPSTADFLYHACVKEALATDSAFQNVRMEILETAKNLPIDIIDKILEFAVAF